VHVVLSGASVRSLGHRQDRDSLGVTRQ